MAERQGTTNSSASVHSTNNIRTIVENVVNHPQFRSLLTDAVGSSRQTPEFVNEENNGAQWSRTNVNNATSNTTSANPGRSTYASPVEEFRSIFRFGSSSRQQGGGPVASFCPIGPTIGLSTSSTAGRRNRRNFGRNQRSSASRSSSISTNQGTDFAREVVLLNRPTDCTTVRGKAKADLMKNGHVISSFDFQKNWSDQEIIRRIGTAFEDKLEGSRFGLWYNYILQNSICHLMFIQNLKIALPQGQDHNKSTCQLFLGLYKYT